MRFTRTGPIAVIFVAEEGAALAARIATSLPDATLWAPHEDLHPDARNLVRAVRPVHEYTLPMNESEHVAALALDEGEADAYFESRVRCWCGTPST